MSVGEHGINNDELPVVEKEADKKDEKESPKPVSKKKTPAK